MDAMLEFADLMVAIMVMCAVVFLMVVIAERVTRS